MEIVLFLAIFNFIILLFAFKTKKILYTITPEKQWKKETDTFDKNYKTLTNIKIDNFKLGTGHVYEKK